MTNQTERAVERLIKAYIPLSMHPRELAVHRDNIDAARAEVASLSADRQAMSDHLRRAIEWAPVEGPDGEWWTPWVAHARELTDTESRAATEEK